MLSKSDTELTFSQPTFACHVCGSVEKRTGRNQKCCARCKRERWLQYFRDYSHQRPKRGKRAFGEVVACAKCGAKIELKHSSTKFCGVCAKPKRTKIAVIDSTFACLNCSVIVVKTARRQCYCSDCFTLRKNHALPSYKLRKSEDAHRRYRADAAHRARLHRMALKFQNKKYATDATFAINVRMRTAIGASLTGQKNGRRWESLVGYTLADLMLHLERQFLEGMSWDNRGEWHIDHIRPLSMFAFKSVDDEGFKAVWALSNLRPLWGHDNQTKWAKRTHLL